MTTNTSKTHQLHTFHTGRIHTIKAGMSEQDLRDAGYFERHPDAIITKAPPSTQALERMVENGTATAIDGCRGIETDGDCPHGHPSWLKALGYI